MPQDLMEPVLLHNAQSRGAQVGVVLVREARLAVVLGGALAEAGADLVDDGEQLIAGYGGLGGHVVLRGLKGTDGRAIRRWRRARCRALR